MAKKFIAFTLLYPTPLSPRLPIFDTPIMPFKLDSAKKKHYRNNIQKVKLSQAFVRRYLVRKKFHKILKQITKRRRICTELLTTEKSYVESLSTLETNFYKQMEFNIKTSPEPICSKMQFDTIFHQILLILQVNKRLLEKIELAMQNYSANSTRLGPIFEEITPYLKIYTQYCSNYEVAQKTVTEISRQPKSLNFLENAQRIAGQSLLSYLIMPVQRIPRYNMLLHDLVKNTWPDHPDYADLSAALLGIQSVADYVNEGIRSAQNIQRIVEIQEQIRGGNPPNLVEPHRRFIKEGALLKPHKRWFFLFNDTLVYCKITSEQKKVYSYKGQIPLGPVWIHIPEASESTSTKSDTLKHNFLMVAPKKTYELCAESESEKNEWINTIQKMIDELVKKDPSLIKQRVSIQTRSTKMQKFRSKFGGGTATSYSRRPYTLRQLEKSLEVIPLGSSSKAQSLISPHLDPQSALDFVLFDTVPDRFDDSSSDSDAPGTPSPRSKSKNSSISTQPTAPPTSSSDVKVLRKQQRSLTLKPTISTSNLSKITISSITEREISGFLTKRGGSQFRDWKERFFILQAGFLFYFPNDNSRTALSGVIPLSGYYFHDDPSISGKKKFGFRLSQPGARTWYVFAKKQEQYNGWKVVLLDRLKITTGLESASIRQVNNNRKSLIRMKRPQNSKSSTPERLVLASRSSSMTSTSSSRCSVDDFRDLDEESNPATTHVQESLDSDEEFSSLDETSHHSVSSINSNDSSSLTLSSHPVSPTAASTESTSPPKKRKGVFRLTKGRRNSFTSKKSTPTEPPSPKSSTRLFNRRKQRSTDSITSSGSNSSLNPSSSTGSLEGAILDGVTEHFWSPYYWLAAQKPVKGEQLTLTGQLVVLGKNKDVPVNLQALRQLIAVLKMDSKSARTVANLDNIHLKLMWCVFHSYQYMNEFALLSIYWMIYFLEDVRSFYRDFTEAFIDILHDANRSLLSQHCQDLAARILVVLYCSEKEIKQCHNQPTRILPALTYLLNLANWSKGISRAVFGSGDDLKNGKTATISSEKSSQTQTTAASSNPSSNQLKDASNSFLLQRITIHALIATADLTHTVFFSQFLSPTLDPILVDIKSHTCKLILIASKATHNKDEDIFWRLIQRHGCRILGKIPLQDSETKNPQMLKAVVASLSGKPPYAVQLAASKSLLFWSNNNLGRTLIVDQFALGPLISCLKANTAVPLLRTVSTIMMRFAHSSPTYANSILDAGILPNLIEALSSHDDLTLQNLVKTLSKLSSKENIQTALRDLNALPALFSLLSNQQDFAVLEGALLVLTNMTQNDAKNREIIRKANGLSIVLRNLELKSSTVHRAALLAISNLCNDKENIEQFLKLGTLDIIAKILPTADDPTSQICSLTLSAILSTISSRDMFKSSKLPELLLSQLSNKSVPTVISTLTTINSIVTADPGKSLIFFGSPDSRQKLVSLQGHENKSVSSESRRLISTLNTVQSSAKNQRSTINPPISVDSSTSTSTTSTKDDDFDDLDDS